MPEAPMTPDQPKQHTEYCLKRRAQLIAEGRDPDQGIFKIPHDFRAGDCLYCWEGKHGLHFAAGSAAALPMTTDEARRHREFCEQAILRQLHELTKITGLDIARVEVLVIVNVRERSDGDPRREAHSVRIDLAV